MTGKFKPMTFVEDAELDGLRQRQIKDYNRALNSLTKMQVQIFKIFDDSELSHDGKYKILAQIQEPFGFLLNKFKNASHPPVPVLPRMPALPLPAPDDLVGDGPPAALVERDKKDYFSQRESVEEEECTASTENLSPQRSDKDLTISSNRSFLTVQLQPVLSLPSQEEAKIPSQYTNKFALLTTFLNEINLSRLMVKRKLFCSVSPSPLAIFQPSCAHSIREISL